MKITKKGIKVSEMFIENKLFAKENIKSEEIINLGIEYLSPNLKASSSDSGAIITAARIIVIIDSFKKNSIAKLSPF